jgi:hypothetical protein
MCHLDYHVTVYILVTDVISVKLVYNELIIKNLALLTTLIIFSFKMINICYSYE